MTTEKKSCSDCSCSIKGFLCKMPKEIKALYIITAILLILSIFNLTKGASTSSIEAWVKENPKTMLESIEVYVKEMQGKAQEDMKSKAKEKIPEMKEEIQSSTNSGVINPKGKKVVVEFFDYNCGYCKQVSKTIEELSKQRKDVKVVLKQLPIFGGASMYAAQVATVVAMKYPNKFVEFHKNMMNSQNTRDEKSILNIVKKSGISVSKVERFLKSESSEIQKTIDSNIKLAQALGINGTPAFIIEEELVPGAISLENIISILDK